MDFQRDDISMNTMVEAGSSIKGDVYSAGLMKINGDIDGNVESAGKIIIGAKARIRADVKAQSVIVCGVVEGDIIAPESVHIFSDSIVLGDVVTKKIKIEDNVIFQGRCISLNDEDLFENAKKKWVDIKAISGKTFSTRDKEQI